MGVVMQKIFLTTCSVLFAGAAFAADVIPAPIVTKAPVSYNPFIGGSGFYLGLGTEAAVASANVNGNVITLPGITGGSTNAAGGMVDIDVGYIWGACFFGTWCQLEADARYTNITGNTAVGNINNQWSFTQEADIGIDAIQTLTAIAPQLANVFPSFNPTSLLPSSVAVAATPRGYVGFKQEEALLNANVGASTGQTWIYAPGVTSGFRWQTLNAAGKPNGGSLKIFADILWPSKGVTIANLFGAAGAPMVTAAGASWNTVYEVGIHYDFGL
jgi:hypothetical protein